MTLTKVVENLSVPLCKISENILKFVLLGSKKKKKHKKKSKRKHGSDKSSDSADDEPMEKVIKLENPDNFDIMGKSDAIQVTADPNGSEVEKISKERPPSPFENHPIVDNVAVTTDHGKFFL